MPANNQTPWLICYDIADPTRLKQVHKSVLQYGTPFQYSVFRAYATRREVVRRLDLLEPIIDSRQDDIRAYPLLTASAPIVYGRRLLADGVHVANGRLFFDSSIQEPRGRVWR